MDDPYTDCDYVAGNSPPATRRRRDDYDDTPSVSGSSEDDACVVEDLAASSPPARRRRRLPDDDEVSGSSEDDAYVADSSSSSSDESDANDPYSSNDLPYEAYSSVPPPTQEMGVTRALEGGRLELPHILDAFKKDSLHWSEQFCSIIDRLSGPQHTRVDLDSERQPVLLELAGLSESFFQNALFYGKILISERFLPPERKTIQVASEVGGIAGGDKYIVQGILFKFALDSSNIYNGDLNAAKSVDHEMKSLSSIVRNRGENFSVHVPLMGLVHYRGFTLVAVSLLPIHGAESLIYGSMDGGTTVQFDNTEMNAADSVDAIARSMNLKPHTAGRSTKRLSFPTDVEAHRGDDGRIYVIDCARVFPAEPPTTRGAFLYRLLREEVVTKAPVPLCSDAFSAFQRGDVEAELNNRSVSLVFHNIMERTVPQCATVLREKFPLDSRHEAETLESLGLFPDQIMAGAGAVSVSVATAPNRDGDTQRPGRGGFEPSDSQTGIHFPIETAAEKSRALLVVLRSTMRKFGLNMRFLGALWWVCPDPGWDRVILTEMVLRTAKSTCRALLRRAMKHLKIITDEPYVQSLVSYFNLLLGRSANSADYWRGEMARSVCRTFFYRKEIPPPLSKKPGSSKRVNGAFDCLGPDGLLDAELGCDRFSLSNVMRSSVDIAALFVELPKMLGLRLADSVLSRTLSVFSLETVIQPADILELSPMEKHFSVINVADAVAHYQKSLSYSASGSAGMDPRIPFLDKTQRVRILKEMLDSESHIKQTATTFRQQEDALIFHCERAVHLLEQAWPQELLSGNRNLAFRTWLRAAGSSSPQITARSLPGLTRFAKKLTKKFCAESPRCIDDDGRKLSKQEFEWASNGLEFARDCIAAQAFFDYHMTIKLSDDTQELTPGKQSLHNRIKLSTGKIFPPELILWVSSVNPIRSDFRALADLGELSASSPITWGDISVHAERMRSLDLTWVTEFLSARVLREIAHKTPKLELLCLGSFREALPSLFSWTQLKYLEVQFLESRTPQTFDFLRSCGKTLTHIRFSRMGTFPAGELKHLASICFNVEDVRLENISSAAVFEDIDPLLSLESLRVFQLVRAPQKLQDYEAFLDSLDRHGTAKNIHCLSIVPTRRVPEDMVRKIVDKLPSLRTMDFSWPITEADLLCIARSRVAENLESLNVKTKVKVCDRSLAEFLRRCSNLRSWTTSNADCVLSPQILDALSPKTEYLSIDSAASVDLVAALEIASRRIPSLLELRLSRCERHPASAGLGRVLGQFRSLLSLQLGSLHPKTEFGAQGFEALARGTPVMQKFIAETIYCQDEMEICEATRWWPELREFSANITHGSSRGLQRIFSFCRKLRRAHFELSGTICEGLMSAGTLPPHMVKLSLGVPARATMPYQSIVRIGQENGGPLVLSLRDLEVGNNQTLIRSLGAPWGNEPGVTFVPTFDLPFAEALVLWFNHTSGLLNERRQMTR